MHLASDNTGPAHPKVIEAIVAANDGWAQSYGNDTVTRRAVERVKRIFEAPEASVHFVATGTAANALALATLTRPFEAIYCTPLAHVHVDECNAPEAFTGGAKLIPVGSGDKMTPADLDAALGFWDPDDVHRPGPGAVTITQVTERGRLYTLDEIAALAEAAHAARMPLHLDGARFANACVALGCTAAEMTWRLGVDAVSFGGTKNGLLGAEAVVFFDAAREREFLRRRKRAAQLFSKSRFLAAQMDAYLAGDLWREMAARANDSAAYLAAALRGIDGVEFAAAPEANMLFVRMERRLADVLNEAGAAFTAEQEPGRDGTLLFRLVCDWSIGREPLDRFAAVVRAA